MKSEQRKRQINKLIHKLELGKNVSNRDIKSALLDSEYDTYNKNWTEEKESRTAIKPDKILRYQKLLREACLAYHKYDLYSNKSSPDEKTLTRLRQKTDITFQKAIEFIQDSISSDNKLKPWIDRDPFDSQCYPLTPSSIPRVIGSKSHECLVKEKVPYQSYSKRQLKEIALLAALDSLERGLTQALPETFNPPKKRTKNYDFSDFKF